MQVCHLVGLKAVVVSGIAIIVMVVIDHQTMLQRLCQRLHLTLQLRGRPARHRLAEHGQQQEKNWCAFHGAAQYTFGPIPLACDPEATLASHFQAGVMVVGA